MNNNNYKSKTKVYLIDFWIDNFRSPVIRELMKLTGIPSTSHQRTILNQLVKDGAIFKSGKSYIPQVVWNKLQELRKEQE